MRERDLPLCKYIDSGGEGLYCTVLALNGVSYKTGRGRVLASREDRDEGVQLGKERHIYLQ